MRVTLSGFDTHSGQAATQARLLGELAGGLVALKAALDELGRWNDTLVLTYAEFGRRPKENLSNGTDHGTANVHFALGGRVAGGLYGEQPSLERLSGDGNTGYAIDFRSVYATVLDRWWGVAVDAARSAGGSRRCRCLKTVGARRRAPQVAFASQAAMNSRQCGAPVAAIFSRANETSVAYSPAVSSPRSSWKRR